LKPTDYNSPPQAQSIERGAQAEAPRLEWRVHLARRQPRKTALALGLMIGAAAWSVVVFGNVTAPAASVALLIGALSEYLFPVRYRLTGEGAEARGPFYWRKIAWQEVRRVYVGEQEIKLSPLPHPGPREGFRGVLLRCPDNQEPVRELVEQFRRTLPTER
jgi:hypothetical protein